MRNMFADELPGGRGPFGRDERGHDRREARRSRGGRGMPDFGPGFEMPNFGALPGMPGMGGRGGRGPGRGRRGDVRNAVLALLAEEPMNGYQIIAAIQDRSQGLWRPGPGSVYPALNLLTDEGLISTVDLDGKSAHALTDAGKAYVAEHADEVDEPWARVAEPHKGFLDVRQELGQLGMALHQVVQAGDHDQIAAARDILTKARKDLYRILAGE